jgi:hypothetical protein
MTTTNTTKNREITRCVIAPSIGIARVGNSPDEFFIGPEAPGVPAKPDGGFKDGHGRIKRQAARFRVYGLDAKGRVVAELTEANAKLAWTVHLANRKAEWYAFENRFNFRPEPPLVNPDYVAAYPPVKKPDQYTPRRNAKVADRASLVIDPGPRSIEGRRREGAAYRFDTGSFMGKTVPLGELRTDERGRLLVLGGFGRAASLKPDNPISVSSFNNDDWHDDMSDGTVEATVRLPDGRELRAEPARVVVAPPDFAPGLRNIVSLYDVVAERLPVEKNAPPPSFSRDIYPLLQRVVGYQWVSDAAQRGHGPGMAGDLLGDALFPQMRDNSAAARPFRDAVYKRIRVPSGDPDSPAEREQASFRFMPPLGGDASSPATGDARTWLHVTPRQHALLARWAAGDFVADWNGHPPTWPTLEELPLEAQTHALVQAALENCVGGGFHPGIEITYIIQHESLFAAPLRFKPELPPGDITKYMALPWHGDFFSCHLYWWPAQRPEVVITQGAYDAYAARLPGGAMGEALPGGAADPPGPDNMDPKERAASQLAQRLPWDRGLLDYFEHPGLSDTMRQENAMVELWGQMGFVTPRTLPWGEVVHVESERQPFAGLDVRDLYFRLQNVDDHPEVLPKARWFIDRCLAQARDAERQPDFPEAWRYFDYSAGALNGRLTQIYNDLVIEAERYDPATDPTYRTREDVLVWLTQMAPFNQNDGAWIRRVTPSGPLSAVDALLFNIWMDEAGDGKPQWSHCNLYTNMLHGLGLYFPDVRSIEYAQEPRFFDSAFTVPALELAIAEHSASYYPEILGFTLSLEWTVLSIRPAAMLLEYYGIDPHFYTLHIGIDNASAGHGAKARQAIELYLDGIRQRGGDEAVAEHWRRIWTGFVAFGMTGTVGQDVQDYIQQRPTPADVVAGIITAKKAFAAQNHGKVRLGPNLLNDWFEDPPGLMAELVRSGFIVPGDPDRSPFFQRISFSGPMFKVFTDAEVDALRAWTLWLAKPAPPPAVDYGVEMADVIATLRGRQGGALGHATHTLNGPDPAAPHEGGKSGKTVQLSVADWFAQAGTHAGVLRFMHALADPDNGWIEPGRPERSPFVNDLLAASNAMGRTFDERQGTTGLTRREIAVQWIKLGCPVPGLSTQGGAKRLNQFAAPRAGSLYPRPRIFGNGAAH